MPKMTDFDPQKPPKMTPISNQKTTKNRYKKRSEKRAHVEAVLGSTNPNNDSKIELCRWDCEKQHKKNERKKEQKKSPT